MAMGNIDAWILRTANQSIGHLLGITFTDSLEITAPAIILGGMIAAWIVFHPRRTRY
jgi:hypothetical protein